MSLQRKSIYKKNDAAGIKSHLFFTLIDVYLDPTSRMGTRRWSEPASNPLPSMWRFSIAVLEYLPLCLLPAENALFCESSSHCTVGYRYFSSCTGMYHQCNAREKWISQHPTHNITIFSEVCSTWMTYSLQMSIRTSLYIPVVNIPNGRFCQIVLTSYQTMTPPSSIISTIILVDIFGDTDMTTGIIKYMQL